MASNLHNFSMFLTSLGVFLSNTHLNSYSVSLDFSSSITSKSYTRFTLTSLIIVYFIKFKIFVIGLILLIKSINISMLSQNVSNVLLRASISKLKREVIKCSTNENNLSSSMNSGPCSISCSFLTHKLITLQENPNILIAISIPVFVPLYWLYAGNCSRTYLTISKVSFTSLVV